MFEIYNPGQSFTAGSGFGPRIHPITKRESFHGGTDYRSAPGGGAIAGLAIPAAARGVVVDAGFQLNPKTGTGWGNYVVLEHTRPDGTKFQTLYAHLQSPTPLADGAIVEAGQSIGQVGSTGGSDGPHIHAEVIVGGNARPATMGGTAGTRLDITSFTDWGGLPHMAGTDAAGNLIVAQQTGSLRSGTWTESIQKFNSTRTTLIDSTTSTTAALDDGAGNTRGWLISNQYGDGSSYNAVLDKDGNLLRSTEVTEAGKIIVIQSGVRMETDPASGSRRAYIVGGPEEGFAVSADGVVTVPVQGAMLSIRLMDDPFAGGRLEALASLTPKEFGALHGLRVEDRGVVIEAMPDLDGAMATDEIIGPGGDVIASVQYGLLGEGEVFFELESSIDGSGELRFSERFGDALASLDTQAVVADDGQVDPSQRSATIDIGGVSVEVVVAMIPEGIELAGFRSVNGQTRDFELVNAALSDLHAGPAEIYRLLEGSSVGAVGQLVNAAYPSVDGGWKPVSEVPESPWYDSFEGQFLGGALTHTQSLLAAIQGGKPLYILSSTFSLAHHLTRHRGLDGNLDLDSGDPTLATGAEALSALTSLAALESALDRGDAAATLKSGLELAQGVLAAYQGVLLSQIVAQYGSVLAARFAVDGGDAAASELVVQYDSASSSLGSLGTAISVVGLFVSIENGDTLGAVAAIATLMDIPYVGWIIAAYKLFEGMFHDYDIEGNVEFSSASDSRHVTTRFSIDTDGGGALLQNALTPILRQIDTLLEANPDLGLAPARMPKLHYQGGENGDSGEYLLTWTDAATGKELKRVFDHTGKLIRVGSGLSVAPGDETAVAQGDVAYSEAYHLDLIGAYLMAFEASQALVPTWEVQTIARQGLPIQGPTSGLPEQFPGGGDGGPGLIDPMAGKTTLERARADGQLLASDPGRAAEREAGAQQNVRPVVIDLGGDGITVTARAEGGGVLVDVDDDGFAEQTDWVGPREGILVLDRDGDGRIAGGHEMFTDSRVDMAARGLGVLEEIDANHDGLLNADDPVFAHLRVWQDINHDGVVQRPGGSGAEAHVLDELLTLASLGITSLDIHGGLARRAAGDGSTSNPNAYQMALPTLQANAAGFLVNSTGNSLLVAAETDVAASMYASAAADKSAGSDAAAHVHASIDGVLVARDELVDSSEDVTTLIATRLLLRNEEDAGATGLTVTAVGTGQHGSATLDAARSIVTFAPEANFAGIASFEYTVTDGAGHQVQARAYVDLAPVNDAPTLQVGVELRRARYPDLTIKANGGGEVDITVAYSLPGTARAVASATVPGVEVAQLGPMLLGSKRGIVGLRDGHVVWGAYVVRNSGDSEVLDPPVAWQEVEVTADKVGSISFSDVEDGSDVEIKVVAFPRYGNLPVLPEDGTKWTYEQTDPSAHADSFVLAVTDSSKATFYQTVYINNEGFDPIFVDAGGDSTNGESGTPVLIDLDDNGFHLSSVANSSAFFDFNGDGQREITGWVAPKDGILVFDADASGTVNAPGEIRFGTGSVTDLQALVAYDSNSDGKLSVGDAQWAKFYVWRDADSDGMQESGELLRPAQLGIASFSLASNGVESQIQGNTVHGIGSYTRIDGSVGQVADVAFLTGTETWRADSADEVTAQPAGGVLSTGTGDDRVHGGQGSDTIHAGAGDDRVEGAAGNDTIDGDAGDDLLSGGEGDDVVRGGFGNDSIDGGVGQDALQGGAGNDAVIGGTGDDAIEGGDGNDILSGDDGNDMLSGGRGNDVMGGGVGNDTLDGGYGADALEGGAGNDVYRVDSRLDKIVEEAGAGFDTVMSNVSIAMSANVEVAALTGTADIDATGGTGNERLFGNAGNNRLDGGTGADTLDGGAGDDTYIVDNAEDRVLERPDGATWPADAALLAADHTLAATPYNVEGHPSGGPRGGGVDTVRAAVNWTLGAKVENLVLTGGAVNGTGNELANVISGNELANTLTGAGGSDTLRGGGGDDSYFFARGDGNDRIEHTAGSGRLVFGSGVAAGDLAFERSGSDVVVRVLVNGSSGSDRITLAGWGTSTAGARVDTAVLANGTVISVAEALNHAPVATADQNTLDEDSTAPASGNVLANDVDLDAGDTLHVATPGVYRGSIGTLQISANGNYTYAADPIAVQALRAGQTVDEAFSITVIDDAQVPKTANATLAIHVNGRNDAPALLNAAADADAQVGHVLTLNLPSSMFGDVDSGDALALSATTGGAGALPSWLTFDAATMSLSGTPPTSLAGQTLDVRVTATDTAGASATDTLRLTFTGAPNQAPVLTADAASGSEDDTAINGDVLANDRDADAADILRVVDTGIRVGQSGTLELTEGGSWIYRPSAAAQSLAAGQHAVDEFDITVADRAVGVDEALSATSKLSITLNGVNDAPRLDGSVPDASAQIRHPYSQTLAANLFSDIDTGDFLRWTLRLDDGSALPAWLSFDAATRTLQGTAPESVLGMRYALEVKATDTSGASASTAFNLDVNAVGITLEGTEGADTLRGTDLEDTLRGRGGNDLLDGENGADAMDGGAGDDRYVVDDPRDTVTEAQASGEDTLLASISTVLGLHVENLMLLGADAIDGTGNAAGNVLVGNAAVNRLLGLDGADVLAGGQGDDLIDGGTGDDTYLYFQGEGRDTINDAAGYDTLRFGPGITLDSVVARTITVGGVTRVFIALLGSDGSERADSGIEIPAQGIEQFAFADGSVRSLADLMAASRTVSGTNGNDTLIGDRRDDTLRGSNGNDVLYGRWGNDVLDGDNGSDKLFGEGGNDRLLGGNEADELWGGSGDDVLDGGNGADLMMGGSGHDVLTGGNDADRLDGGTGNDLLDGLNGQDDLYAGDGDDRLDAGNDDDVLAAGPGHDTLVSGNGRDALVGGTGDDNINSGNDNDFIDAGPGADTIVAGNGADFIAAGPGSDTVDAGQDGDVLAFNRGDGADTWLTSSWQRDTLSLGGGIRYASLKLVKSGSDLRIDLGEGDSITLRGWYTDNTRHNLTTIQFVTAASGDYDASSSERLRNQKVVSLNFEALANRFDQWLASHTGQSEWEPLTEMNSFYVAGSNTQAIGGSLAWRYANTGSYGDIDARGAITAVSSLSATAWVTFSASGPVNPWDALQAGTLLVADATAGLPSPIAPAAAPTGDELFFAAVSAGGHKPGWIGTSPAPVLP